MFLIVWLFAYSIIVLQPQWSITLPLHSHLLAKEGKNYIPTAIQKPLQIKEEGDIEILSDRIEVNEKKVFFEILVLREIIQGRRKW